LKEAEPGVKDLDRSLKKVFQGPFVWWQS